MVQRTRIALQSLLVAEMTLHCSAGHAVQAFIRFATTLSSIVGSPFDISLNEAGVYWVDIPVNRTSRNPSM